MRMKQRKFNTCLPVDEGFNRIKAHVTAHGMNTRCTPQRALAVTVDTGVLSKLNKFKEVDRSSIPPMRAVALSPTAFTPPKKPADDDTAMKELNLKSVIGTGPASWYSPTASTMMTPYADIVTRRLAKEQGVPFRMLEFTWLTRLCNRFLLIQPVGSDLWYLSMGSICNEYIKAWPVVKTGKTYSVVWNNTAKSKAFLFVEPQKFSAMPVQPVSPMHKAILSVCQQEDPDDKHVHLPDSATMGKLTIAIKGTDSARPFYHVACREAFWQLPASFIKAFLDHINAEITGGLGLWNLITIACNKLLPPGQVTDDLWHSIYQKRDVAMEPDEDMWLLIEMEFVLDCFDKDERVTLEKEIEKSKTCRSDWESYHGDFKAWKALYIKWPSAFRHRDVLRYKVRISLLEPSQTLTFRIRKNESRCNSVF